MIFLELIYRSIALNQTHVSPEKKKKKVYASSSRLKCPSHKTIIFRVRFLSHPKLKKKIFQQPLGIQRLSLGAHGVL